MRSLNCTAEERAVPILCESGGDAVALLARLSEGNDDAVSRGDAFTDRPDLAFPGV